SRAHPPAAGAREPEKRGGRIPFRVHRRSRVLPGAGHAVPSAPARRGRGGGAWRVTLPLMGESLLERVQADTKAALKSGERDRVGALRLIADALQKDAKEGGSDEVAVLRRERKRRLEA